MLTRLSKLRTQKYRNVVKSTSGLVQKAYYSSEDGLDSSVDKSWEFLLKRHKKPEISNQDANSLENTVFNVSLEDSFAISKNQVIKPSVSSEVKLFNDEERDSKKVVKGDDLRAAFKPIKRRVDRNGPALGITASKAEIDAFSKIFDNLLAKSAAQGTEKAINSSKGQDMMPKLNALFVSITGGNKGKEKFYNEDSSQENEELKMEVTSEDVTKLPLSASSLTMSSQKNRGININSIFNIQKIIKEKFAPILDHLNTLETDLEIVEFYKNKVLAKYQHTSLFDDSNNTKNKSSPSKSAAQRELEALENLTVTPDSFLVDYKTLPFLLKTCMKILDEEFDSPLEALSLFEMTKGTSMDVYIAGCNVDVYNEALRIKWNKFKDLYLVEDLVNEMEVNGIKGNSETTAIVASVASHSLKIKHGKQKTSLWCGEDDERMRNLNQYRIKITEDVLPPDYQQKPILSALMSR